MNTLENKMVLLLLDLKKNHGACEVKAEFETEAARMNELMRLKEIVSSAGLGLVIKVGGCEAISNMFDAQHIGVTGLIAPMVESAYSMSKYLESINKYFSPDLRKRIHFGVNIETIQGFNNLKDILSLKNIKLIDTVTLGRVDMVGSLGIGRSEINSDQIYTLAEEMFTLARKKGFRTTMGGGISTEAIPFIKKLAKKKLLDRFETRKIVFSVPSRFAGVERAIIKANQFELLWLENKKNYYYGIHSEDLDRITMLKKRS